MPLLNHCCFFSLRSGMLLLGWVQAIMGIVSLAGLIVVDSSPSTSIIHQWLGITLKTLYVLLGGSVVQTMAAGFLLFGVYRRKRAYVLEFVKLETLLHIASLLEFLLYLLLEHNKFTQEEVYVFLGFLGLNYGLAVYYLIATYSYYQSMAEEENTPLLQA